MTFLKSHALTMLTILLVGLYSQSIFATTISYETRFIDDSIDNTDYSASWFAQGTSINTQNLSDFTNVLAGHNTFSHLTVSFDVGSAFAGSGWDFQLAPDAGFGGALYLDGNQVDINPNDLWWGGNWGNSYELLTTSFLTLKAGNYVLEGFWAEGCCNGGQSGRFTMDDGATWQNLTVANLDAASVPEPASLALIALGLIGLGFSGKKKVA